MAIDKEGQRSIMTQFQDQALQEGFQIGVYEIQSLLSGSRFDMTYRGWNHHLNAPVVLQEYFPRDFAIRQSSDQTVAPKSEGDRAIYESGLEHFMALAKTLLGQVEHRNIVTVPNTLHINGTAYLITDFEDGAPLSSRADTLTTSQLRIILRSLLSGLEQVHTHAAVHGDIHPSNILLRENGEPVLIDFAAAKLAVCEQRKGFSENLRAGYAAPEQYEPGSRPNPRSDLYALGATMYRCITHNEPVPAPERILAIRASKPDRQAERLSSASARIDDENLLETIGWMLRLKPHDRPISAADVLAALSSQDAAVQLKRTKATPDDRQYTDKPIESPRRAMWTAAIIGFVALIAGLWYLQAEKPAPETVAVKKESPPGTAASKERAIDVAPGSVPPTRAEETTAETRKPIKTEAAAARHQPGDVIQEAAEMETASQPLATTGTEPSPQPATTEHADISTPESLPEPATGSDGTVVVPARKADNVALPSSEAIAASQSDKQPPPKPATDDRSIQSHLAAAEAAIAALRLTTPAENNAYRHYQAVLARDPENV